ncbi:hypothetical protein FOYG_15607 [Fusarium oxysporum NRRL 32931]|uniref:SPS19-peroxisomal 2,4-dienoyl-CoA reductase n=1 Tax=Fusarium oxysporum NRRL 32931 TaxID=660029 RepID=W9HMB4_FUSOX|nr:hypothetical protein FOYG_15607 [Fusarium oxysporum NRRL 32931]
MSRFIPQLTGAHALVTGGTKGIGRVIVETLLSEGVSVSYCSRNVRGDEFANFKDVTDGARAVGTSVDISNAASIQGWVEASAKEFGRIDLVVANACPKYVSPSIEDWEKSFHADVLGLVNLINASEPHLEKCNGTGSIIVISSLAGFEARHPAIRGPYTTLKRAQATLAKDFGRWLGPKGIRINTIVPGTIDSPPVDKPDGTVELSQFQQIMTANPDFLKSLIDSIPLGKVGQAQDIANAVVFLGSSLGKYVNGVNLIVDGGMSTAL